MRVSALVALLKQSLGRAFPSCLVSGEVVDPLLSQRGHLYFRLTDGQSEIRAVMWKRDAERLSSLPKPGSQVTARGNLDLYAPRGDLQLVVSALMQSGRGQKILELARLKERLKADGLFDRPRKPLPAFAARIGLVTSVGSAVLHDIYQSVQARFPSCELLLSPASVSGPSASQELTVALHRLRNLCDVVIVARGGGSFEELLPFSAEELVRAVADFPQPVVAAVGHGSDITLLDLAADHTAATPTAAAVLATPDRLELRDRLELQQKRLVVSFVRRLRSSRASLLEWSHRCTRLHPQAELERKRQTFEFLRSRLSAQGEKGRTHRVALDTLLTRLRKCSPSLEVERKRSRLANQWDSLKKAMALEARHRREALEQLTMRLKALSPHSVLERGYALVKIQNKVVTTVEGRTIGEEMELHLADGRLVVTIKEVG